MMVTVGVVVACLTWWFLSPRPWRTMQLPIPLFGNAFISPDGRFMVASYRVELDQPDKHGFVFDDVLRFIRLDSGQTITEWRGNCRALGFSGDGRWFTAEERDGDEALRLLAFDSDNGSIRTLLELKSLSDAHAVKLSNDQRTLVAHRNQEDKPILEVWDLPSGKIRGLIDLEGHDGECFTISRDSRWLALGDGWRGKDVVEPRGVRVWDLESCELVGRIAGYPHAVHWLYFLEDGNATLRMAAVERQALSEGPYPEFRLAERGVFDGVVSTAQLYNTDQDSAWNEFVWEMRHSCVHLHDYDLNFDLGCSSHWEYRPAAGLKLRGWREFPSSLRFRLGQAGIKWIDTVSDSCGFELLDSSTGRRLWRRDWMDNEPGYQHVVSPSGQLLAEFTSDQQRGITTVTIWKLPISRWQSWAAWLSVASGVVSAILWRAATHQSDVTRTILGKFFRHARASLLDH